MESSTICSFHGFLLLIFTLILTLTLASAAAVAPNMSSCNLPAYLPAGETPFDCCAPFADYMPRLFKPNFSSSSSPLRVRRPAHVVDEAYAEKLARAYALMKALPPEDPRSFVQQSNIHCAYCNEAYNRMHSSELFQVHGSWTFLPFHRWYLYFHERILAKLLGEDDFTISFWNYDHPDGAPIPWPFSGYNLTLGDTLRDPHHGAGAPAAIDYTWDTDARTWETQLRENENTMFRTLIRDATSKELLFGEPYGSTSDTRFGTIEVRPHNSVHLWVGQKAAIGWKDMGDFYAAGRDPLFYAHHAQLDRLWEVWKTLPNNSDIEDEDYLNSEFAFYNEDAELVRVKIGDALNTPELGYVYEEVENRWMAAVPVRRSVGEAKLTANDSVCIEGRLILGPCSLVMERDAEQVEKGVGEYMNFTIDYHINGLTHIDIYINLPSANADTDSGCEEYFTFIKVNPAYLSSNITSDVRSTLSYKTNEISGRLGALNLTNAASLVVTIVPRVPNPSIFPISILHYSLVYSSSSLMENALL